MEPYSQQSITGTYTELHESIQSTPLHLSCLRYKYMPQILKWSLPFRTILKQKETEHEGVDQVQLAQDRLS